MKGTTMIEPVRLSITTTGGSGASGGNATTDIILNGLLVAVDIDATGAHANTDWVFANAGTGRTLFTLTNINTSGFYAPLIPAVTTAAGVAISGAGVVMPIACRVKCTIAQSNDGTYTIDFYVQRN
jgi:hypothetical protein